MDGVMNRSKEFYDDKLNGDGLDGDYDESM